MLSDLVTLGTDDSNQACITPVIVGINVIHLNLHQHNQTLASADCGVIGHILERYSQRKIQDYRPLKGLGSP